MFAVTKRMARFARGAGAALAILATSLLLLQPICAAAEAVAASPQPVSLADDVKSPDGAHEQPLLDSCCISLEAWPVPGGVSAPSNVGARAVLAPHPAYVAQTDGAHALEANQIAALPLPPLRYYVRSARILR